MGVLLPQQQDPARSSELHDAALEASELSQKVFISMKLQLARGKYI